MTTSTIPHPPIASLDQWIVERKKLLTHEMEFTKQRDRINAERCRLPMVKIKKDFFRLPGGPKPQRHRHSKCDFAAADNCPPIEGLNHYICRRKKLLKRPTILWFGEPLDQIVLPIIGGHPPRPTGCGRVGLHRGVRLPPWRYRRQGPHNQPSPRV